MRHGSRIDPPNRFEATYRQADLEQVADDDEYLAQLGRRTVEYLTDDSQSIVSENDSPDVGFRYSVNPYRGCQHGCAYCYARNSHEYLGLSAGLDFETKIIVKRDAPRLFRQFLARKSWQPEVVVFSGVTDCYQPAEREFRLTRQCLEVALDCRQPAAIVTKNALVLRDLDLLKEMTALRLVHVNISVTTLDAELARVLEPRTSIPAARLRAIEALAHAGVPTRVMVAPIIPGLNDTEIAAILAAAKSAGAMSAAHVLLRLPLNVRTVFLEWLERSLPERAEKVKSLIRDTRGGKLNSSSWGERMRGTGAIAEQIHQVFRVFAKKHRLDAQLPDLDFSNFRVPADGSGQLRLF
jgi:DNA repair photolyase